MKKLWSNLWGHEDGAETAEWLLIVGLLVAIGVGAFAPIPSLLTSVVPEVVSALLTAVGP